jgi:hypothetical protein
MSASPQDQVIRLRDDHPFVFGFNTRQARQNPIWKLCLLAQIFASSAEFKGSGRRSAGASGTFFPPWPGYPLPGCSPAEPDSVSPDKMQGKR